MSAKKRIQDLSELKNIKFKKDTKKDVYILPYKKKAPPKEEKVEPGSPAEEEIFMSAMQGVKPMSNSAGRKVPSPSPLATTPTALEPEEEARKTLQRYMTGNVEFELEYTDDFMYGYVLGLDIKTFQQLRSGSLEIARSLDLHGMTITQAQESLLFFIRESYLHGHRCVLVVTGKGINSPGGQSVLRRETETWLTQTPLKRVVLAFCTAQPRDGGAGALYILLRKQKKTDSTMEWDSMQNWEEN